MWLRLSNHPPDESKENCGGKKSDKVDEHDDTFNKDEVHTKASVKYPYYRSKNNEYQELYVMTQKSFYDKF